MINPGDLKYKVFMCHKSKEELVGTKALKYIEFGELKKYHLRPSCRSRQKWWDLGIRSPGSSGWIYIVRDRMFSPYNKSRVYVDNNLFDVFPKSDDVSFACSANTTLTILVWEMSARSYGGGGGPLKSQVYEVEDFLIIDPSLFDAKEMHEDFFTRPTQSVITELGFDPSRPIREQEPNPLPDRKALDDVVFDAIGLTDDERKEVYWAVAELVKNRLDKARSVRGGGK